MVPTNDIFVVIIIMIELILVGAKMNKQIYEKVIILTDLSTSDTPLKAISGVANMGNCATLCFEEPLCGYQSLFRGTCSLYRNTPFTMGDLLGVSYFTKFGDTCPISKGYISVYVPRLCFKPSVAYGTWPDAQSQCQKDGGRLILLNTYDRHDFIANYWQEQGSFSPFVGMTDADGVFKWTDGSDYVKQWAFEEPDFVSYQKCVALYPDGLGDIPCDQQRNYICEILIVG